MQGMYSMRSPAVKRLMKEAYELREPTEQYECHPLEDNLFEWHFTIRGPADTEFDGGLYHGRIILPPEYPMKPPSIIMLTPNGRFETSKKICLSISGHHPESWQPSWSIRTALLAIIGFMPTHGAGALGSLDYKPEERKRLAKRSQDFRCPNCGDITNVLKEVTEESETTKQEAQELASQMSFQNEQEKNAALKATTSSSAAAPPTESEPVKVTSSQPASSPQPATASPSLPDPNHFAQFPFRMPFMPPFPATQFAGPLSHPYQQTSSVLSQVPRFPLPFVSPFMTQFPPFLPPAGLPMPPGAQGMFPPPWATRQAPTMNPSTSTGGSNTSDSRPSPVTLATVGATTSVTNTRNFRSTTETVHSNDSPPTTDNPAASGSTSSQEASSSQPTTKADSSVREETTTRSVTEASGIRHRNLGASNTVPTTDNQLAEEDATNRQTETGFVIFVTVIICIIMLLLLKRMYYMFLK